MNLHSIVSGAIGTINPSTTITVQYSAGTVVAADGSQSPTYTTQSIQAQVQPLTYSDEVKANGLNLQGLRKKIYINGQVNGMIRSLNNNGDLVTLPDGSVWKVALVENWADWCNAIITLQNGS